MSSSSNRPEFLPPFFYDSKNFPSPQLVDKALIALPFPLYNQLIQEYHALDLQHTSTTHALKLLLDSKGDLNRAIELSKSHTLSPSVEESAQILEVLRHILVTEGPKRFPSYADVPQVCHKPQSFLSADFLDECLDRLPSYLFNVLAPMCRKFEQSLMTYNAVLHCLTESRGDFPAALQIAGRLVSNYEFPDSSISTEVIAKLQELQVNDSSRS